MKTKNERVNLVYNGVNVTVDYAWYIHALFMCHHNDPDYEDPEKETLLAGPTDVPYDVLRKAFENIYASAVKSLSNNLMRNIHRLSGLQYLIKKYENEELIYDCGIIVRLAEDMEEAEEEQFEILCNGKVYSNFVSCETAQDLIQALIQGMRMAQVLSKKTSAGTLKATIMDNQEVPGISLFFIPKDHNAEIDLAIAEVKEDPDLRHDGETEEDVALYVYGNYSTDQWTDRYDYPRAGILKVLQ